ncbi:hypothetical protein V3565_04310 [Bartonella sp. B10]
MNTKYFFIAGAITSGLAFALETSERVVQQQYPFISNFTAYKADLHINTQTNESNDSSNTSETETNNEISEEITE